MRRFGPPRWRRARHGLAARLVACLALGAPAALLGPASAAGQELKLTQFGAQTYDRPLHVTGAPGDPSAVFVVEASGRVLLVRDGVTRPEPFLDIRDQVLDLGEEDCPCGMFSMAAAPDYAETGRFYVFFTRDEPDAPDGEGFIRVDEFRRASAGDVADPATQRRVLSLPSPATLTHFGGQLAFGPDGYLYVSIGDTGAQAQARSLHSPYGKILRIDPRGSAPGAYSIPPGNPFADGPGPNADEIYAYGLRNPYRFSFDRATGDLAIGDVGQSAFEEIDFVSEGEGRGADFGWHCLEGSNPRPGPPPGCASPPPNPTPPALEYAHPPSGAVSVTSGFVVRDPGLPSLAGRLLYADSSGALDDQVRSARVTPAGSTGDETTGLILPGLVSFGQDACGHVYAASLGGVVNRVDPAQGPLACRTGPSLSVDPGRGARAAKHRGIVLRIRCDEDCDAAASGRIAIKRTGAARGLKLGADRVSIRLRAGVAVEVSLGLAKAEARKLRRALKAGRRATARFSVSATGGGGGTETDEGSVRQRR